MSQDLDHIHLGVKRILLQLVRALELPSVGLGHNQLVFASLKDLGLVNFTDLTPGEVSLLDDKDPGHLFPFHP